MSVVSPPSTNTEIGNSGAGNSTTQLSAIAWATSNIDINTIQASRLYPAFSSGDNREFAWFHSKKFRVMWVRGITNGGSGSSASITSPNSSSGQNFSYRYDTYSTIQLTCSPTSPATFSHWAYGTTSAPLPSSISTANPVTIASTDWTSTDYFNIWCVCNAATTTSFCSIPGYDDGVNTIALTNDGLKIYLGGRFTTFNGSSCSGIVRLNLDGTIDTAFNVGTGFNVGSGIEIWKILVQSDNKVVVVGEFTTYKGTTYNKIVRLNTDGTVDTGFTMGSGFNNSCQGAALQSDGKIIVVGDFTTYNGTSIGRGVVRLNTDGTRDTGFGTGTGVTGTSFPQVWDAGIQTDGKIVITGGFTSYNGTGRNHLCRLNSDGSLDTGFTVGTGISSSLSTPGITVKVLGNGDILVGGAFSSYNGNTAYAAFRVNSDGSFDSGFEFKFSSGSFYVQSIVETTYGKYLFGGNFFSYNSGSADSIIMTNTDGTIYTTFAVGAGISQIVNTAIETPSGQFFVGGYIDTYKGVDKGGNLILLNSNGDAVETCTWTVEWSYSKSSPSGYMELKKNTTSMVYATSTSSGTIGIIDGEYLVLEVDTLASKFMCASAFGIISDQSGTLWTDSFDDCSGAANVISPNTYPTTDFISVEGISSEY